MKRYLCIFIKFLLIYSLLLLFSCFLTFPIFAHSLTSFSNTLSQTFIKLTPCYKKPTSLKDRDTLTLQGMGYGEYLEVKVIGTIKNVKLTGLVYNEQTDSFDDFQTLGSFETLHNQTLVISTYFPCGMPHEKLTWQSLSGEEYSYIIAENGEEGLKTITYTHKDPFIMPALPTPPMLPIAFRSPSDIPAISALYFMVPLF